MTIVSRFSRSNGVRGEHLNKAIAAEIVASHNLAAVFEIMAILSLKQRTDILSDALKVIEMIGQKAPELVENTFDEVISLLHHPANQIQWRAMSALSTFCQFHHAYIFETLGDILQLMDSGSVITRDHGVKILVMLYEKPAYRKTISALLEEQLMTAPDNQLGQYAEKWMAVIHREDIPRLAKRLEERQPELVSLSHQKRIARVLAKLKNFTEPN